MVSNVLQASGEANSEIAPRRRGGRRVNRFVLRNSPNSANSVSLMKIKSRSHRQFLQADFVTESLQPVKAAFGYSLTVAFIKVVSTEIRIRLFAS